MLFRKLISFLIYTNFFLAACVTSLVVETYILLDIKEFDFNYLIFIFCSTVSLYCFHSLFKISSSDKNTLSERHLWIIHHKYIFHSILALAILGGLFSALHFSFFFLLYLFPVILISLAYTIPILPIKNKFIPIRDIPGIKIFLISFVLSVTTVLLPTVLYHNFKIINHTALFIVFVRRMLFIFAITIPFDIRDIKLDRIKNTLTIPVLLGEKNAKIMALVSLLIFLILSVLDYYIMPIRNVFVLMALIISAVISGILINLSGPQKSIYFYAVFIEGLMLFQSLLVVISTH